MIFFGEKITHLDGTSLYALTCEQTPGHRPNIVFIIVGAVIRDTLYTLLSLNALKFKSSDSTFSQILFSLNAPDS